MLDELLRTLTASNDLFRSANQIVWLVQLFGFVAVLALMVYVYFSYLKPKPKENFYEVKPVKDEYESLCAKEDSTPQSARTIINRRWKCHDLHEPLLRRPLFRTSS